MPSTGEGRCVLVVEDAVDLRSAIIDLLRAHGHHCVGASGAGEALAYLRRHADVALILLDVMMPDDGGGFREEQLKDRRLAAIPVILISAVDGLKEKAARFGVDGYMQKPLDPDVLLAMIERHMLWQ